MKNSTLGLLTLTALSTALFAWWILEPSPDPISTGKPTRGALLDVAGRALAQDELHWQAAINIAALRRVAPEDVERFLADLKARLDLPPGWVSLIDGPAWLKDKHLPVRVDNQKREEIRAWYFGSEWSKHRPAWLRFEPVSVRRYPHAQSSASLVGMVDPSSMGLEGMEYQLDKSLSKGLPAQLTIDVELQSQISIELAQLESSHDFDYAAAVVMDLSQDRVSAIVSYPGFNPDRSSERQGPHVRLRPVTDVVQAGPLIEPFLLHGVLTRTTPSAKILTEAFTHAERDVGLKLAASFDGYESALAHLREAGLLDRLDVDFPGFSSTLVRTTGTPQEKIEDLGRGAGVAPSLLQYSTAFSRILTGRSPHPVRLVLSTDAIQADPIPSASVELQDALVRRARHASNNPHADFGGMWTTYEDRTNKAPAIKRASLVLFAPASSPRYLIAVNVQGADDLGADEVLMLGQRLILACQASYGGEVGQPQDPSPSVSSPSITARLAVLRR